MKQFTNLCVYCGASTGSQPIYEQMARALGEELVRRGIGLVYGGGSIGLMGSIARTVIANGGKVTGVIPNSLKTKEVAGEIFGDLITVNTMHERKAMMARLSDGFIAMPGGFGTLEELFEATTWGQLGIHTKPVGLLNVNHYFDGLLQWIEQAVAHGFIRPHHQNLIIVANEPAALIEKMLVYEPPAGLVQWLDLDKA